MLQDGYIMIDLMQENPQLTIVLLVTIVYALAYWMGRNSCQSMVDDAVQASIAISIKITTETVVNELIDAGYICCREEEEDGEMVSYMITYEEYIDSNPKTK